MYVFPRQFGLHNVFTSLVNPQETVQPLKDYALREHEIANLDRHLLLNCQSKKDNPYKTPLPRRLRGAAVELITKMLVLHSRCSYSKLLQHYCPFKVGSDLDPDVSA